MAAAARPPDFQSTSPVPDLAFSVWESWPQGQGLTTVSKVPGSPCLSVHLLSDLALPAAPAAPCPERWAWVELLLQACGHQTPQQGTQRRDLRSRQLYDRWAATRLRRQGQYRTLAPGGRHLGLLSSRIWAWSWHWSWHVAQPLVGIKGQCVSPAAELLEGQRHPHTLATGIKAVDPTPALQ